MLTTLISPWTGQAWNVHPLTCLHLNVQRYQLFGQKHLMDRRAETHFNWFIWLVLEELFLGGEVCVYMCVCVLIYISSDLENSPLHKFTHTNKFLVPSESTQICSLGRFEQTLIIVSAAINIFISSTFKLKSNNREIRRQRQQLSRRASFSFRCTYIEELPHDFTQKTTNVAFLLKVLTDNLIKHVYKCVCAWWMCIN